MTKSKVPVKENNLPSRPPIVAVLGHVDHGKTTLLDKIRQSHLAEKEPGEITQKIGAYQVEVDKKKITFLDTPGHEAFIKMRQRGTQITDLAVLVVASDNGVMPQTKESIRHLNETSTPFIVALSKVDLPSADPQRVKQQLAKEGVLVEELGGKVVCLPISAKTGQGIKELLEMILLLAEMEDLRADPKGPLKLAVIESKMDHRKGPVATVIVQQGTLKTGQTIELGGESFRVRGMINERGENVKEAGPGEPVEILGPKEIPKVGETTPFKAAPKEAETENPKLKVILKTDISGSLEAILESLPQGIEILSCGVGEINESDILAAQNSGAIVVGFNLKTSKSVAKLAETEGVLMKTYSVIYELLSELEDAGLAQAVLNPEEEILGRAKIVAQFPFDKQKIAGCEVMEGRICRGDQIKVLRLEEEIGRARIKTLKHLKEDISKAEVGLDCGALLNPQLDFQPGDVLISYKI